MPLVLIMIHGLCFGVIMSSTNFLIFYVNRYVKYSAFCFQDFQCYSSYSISIHVTQVPGLQLKLPGKKLFGNNLDPQFIASRQEGLDMFLQQLMQDKKLLEM